MSLKNRVHHNVMPNISVYIFLVIVLIAFSAYLLSLNETSVTIITPSGRAMIGTELADTAEKQVQGLSGRDSLGTNRGMLFIFPREDKYVFWMKDMKFPLDIIFISSDLKIIDIIRDLQPCSTQDCPVHTSGAPAKYVIEVNSGFVEKNDVHVGNSIEIGILTVR